MYHSDGLAHSFNLSSSKWLTLLADVVVSVVDVVVTGVAVVAPVVEGAKMRRRSGQCLSIFHYFRNIYQE